MASLGELTKGENQLCSNASLRVTGKWAIYYFIYNILGPPLHHPLTQLFWPYVLLSAHQTGHPSLSMAV